MSYTALLCLPEYLKDEAQRLFLVTQNLPESAGAFTMYPGAVNFLLREFAKDSYIEKAIDKLDAIAQKPDESEDAYAKRLRDATSACGSVHNEYDVVQRFIRNLNPTVKPLMSTALHTSRFRSLTEATEAALKYGDSFRSANARPDTRQTSRARVNAIEINAIDGIANSDTTRSAYPTDSSALARADALAGAHGTHDRDGHTCDDVTFPSIPTTEVPDEPGMDAEVAAMTYGAPDRRPAFAKPTGAQRPGWEFKPDLPHTICFLCFARGHSSPRCPWNGRVTDPQTKAELNRYAEANFCRLTDAERTMLHRAGRSPFSTYNPPALPANVDIADAPSKAEPAPKN